MICFANNSEWRTTIDAHLLAALILTPFVLAFIYAGVHEYLRYKSEGRATYGLVFDEETGTSYVTGIGEEEEGFDPEDFDPGNYNDTGAADEVGRNTGSSNDDALPPRTSSSRS